MAEGAAVAAIGGTILSVEGQKKAARSEAAAARRNAEAKRLEAMEVLERFEINASALKQQSEVSISNELVSRASRNVDVGTGTTLDLIDQSRGLVLEQIMLDEREAKFRAKQLEIGADIDQRLATDILSAQRLRTLGTFLSGTGTAVSAGAKK